MTTDKLEGQENQVVAAKTRLEEIQDRLASSASQFVVFAAILYTIEIEKCVEAGAIANTLGMHGDDGRKTISDALGVMERRGMVAYDPAGQWRRRPRSLWTSNGAT